MATSAQRQSTWSRRYVGTGVAFLVVWALAALVGVPRHAGVVLGVYGFVLHTVFGKAYALVPSYFDRELPAAWPAAVQFPLVAVGTGLLALGAAGVGPPPVSLAGGILWSAGVAVFVGTLVYTVRDNLTGAETGTGGANADRRPLDRLANAFVPVALLYLLAGSYETLALHAGVPALVGFPAAASHLLAAGAATVLVFAVGFRLLPRFLVATPPGGRALAATVLVPGAVGPALLARGVAGAPSVLTAGAALEALAVLGFGAAYVGLFARSDRRRVGFYGVLAAVAAGALGVLLGVSFALGGRTAALVALHARVNVLGFLGLTVVGLTYQFYPPAVSDAPGIDDRTALAAIGLVVGGLAVEAAGTLAGLPVATVADAVVVLGAAVHAAVVGSLLLGGTGR